MKNVSGCRALTLLICGFAGFAAFVAASARAQDDPPKEAKGLWQEYHLSLLNEALDKHPEWSLTGLLPSECVKFEASGLRITLPMGVPKERTPTGVSTGIHAKGDFEITVAYEIFVEPEPADTGEKPTRLLVVLFAPNNNRVAFTRRMNAKGGPQFSTWNSGENKLLPYPAATKTGRMRLVRTGDMLSYWVAEPKDGKFEHLRESRFSAEELIDIRLVATTGGPKASLDVRFSDLKVRATKLPNVPAVALPKPVAPEPAPAPAPAVPIAQDAAERPGHGWLVAAVLIGSGVVVTLAVFTTVGLLLKRRTVIQTPTNATPADSAVPIHFLCPDCGKNLTVQPKLASKKVKCKACGSTVLVPTN
jgi:DNA-directed RNA polymerase subunit RPC12/RpoP